MGNTPPVIAAQGSALVDAYDSALFDLDGVVYLGPIAVPGAVDGLAALRDRGVRTGYVTNNAARTPDAVAAHLVELGITCSGSDVVTSAQAGAQLVADRFGPGSKVLVVGGNAVFRALDEVGLVGVRSVDDEPVAVLQGYAFDLTWEQLNEAAIAIQHGAHWVATNTDSTRPTDRGIVPGNGAAVAAVRTAVDVDPEVAGKPYRPLMDETIARLDAQHAIFVGDRFDTDIAGAVAVGLDSLFVLSGAHGVRELLAADAQDRPTYLGATLAALLEEPRTVQVDGDRAVCRSMCAVSAGGTVTLESAPSGESKSLDALWAVAHLVWAAADDGRALDPSAAVASLDGLT